MISFGDIHASQQINLCSEIQSISVLYLAIILHHNSKLLDRPNKRQSGVNNKRAFFRTREISAKHFARFWKTNHPSPQSPCLNLFFRRSIKYFAGLNPQIDPIQWEIHCIPHSLHYDLQEIENSYFIG